MAEKDIAEMQKDELKEELEEKKDKFDELEEALEEQENNSDELEEALDEQENNSIDSEEALEEQENENEGKPGERDDDRLVANEGDSFFEDTGEVDSDEEPDYSDEQHYEEELIEIFRSNLGKEELLDRLSDYHENDVAGALEQLSVEERKALYPILGAEMVSEVFSYMEDAEEYIKELNLESAARVISHMDADDAADVLGEMDDQTQEKLVSLMDEESSQDVRLILSYDDEEVGSHMTTNFILIKNNLTVRQAMRELVNQAGDNDNISTIYVEDEEGLFYGAIDLKDLIVARDYVDLESLISTSYPYVHDHEDMGECIERIKDYAEDSIPVLDDDGAVIGIITAQDIVEVVDEEMGEDYARLAGLTAEEDLKEKTRDSMKKRLPWLITLLILGMMVSTVVGVFEAVVAVLPIVMCFQSLILDMSGNVGTQSLAVTIRVLMDEELTAKKKLFLVVKEIKVGFANGLFLGIVAFIFLGIYVYYGKGQSLSTAFIISGCVGVSLMLAMIISSMVGTLVPMFFHKINVDPAVASGPLITTVNDLVAVVTYYGLAGLFLIKIMGMG